MKTIAVILIAFLTIISACEIKPRITLRDCRMQCKDSKKSKACYEFCDCIYKECRSLDECLDRYNKAPDDSISSP